MQVIDNLEVALIDLEYAVADIAHCKASTSDPLKLADLEALLLKAVAAKRAVRLAVAALGPTRMGADAARRAA
jgi:hypothetical protein